MNVAVLTLTRDRRAYTEHCFEKLRELAGCDFDHYVLDQASDDDTPEFLEAYYDDRVDVTVILGVENIGVCRGMNLLLDTAGGGYDVYVKFDNDCELLVPDTLKVACELVAHDPAWIVSPHIQGLLQPPPIAETIVPDNEHRVGIVSQLGGVFMAVPEWVYGDAGYRYNERNPLYGQDDTDLSAWFRGQGGLLGYLLDYPANHYLTTAGQQADQPEYFARKFAEMGIV